jgi:GTP-binding protein
VDRLLPAVLSAHDRWAARVPTGLLNRWLRALERHHPPPRQAPKGGSKPGQVTSGGAVRLKYMTQLKGRPPTFAVWVNRAEALRADYLAFLRNNLRDEFGFQGIPMRLLLRSTNTSLSDRIGAKTAAAKAATAKTAQLARKHPPPAAALGGDESVAAKATKPAAVTVKVTPARAPTVPKHRQPHKVRLGGKRRAQSSKGKPAGTAAQRGL